MPGRCPSCNQTYTDETLTFCPNDGTPLVREAAPYDPQAGMYGGAAGQQPGGYPPPPPPQGGYYPGAPQQQPPQAWPQQPYGQQQQQYQQPYSGAQASGAKNKMPIIIAVLALVLIGGGIGLYFLLKGDSSSTNSTTSTSGSPGTTSTRSTGSTTTIPTPGTTTSSTTTATAGSYSEDDKHKLFQAVGITQDNALIIEVAQKIGIVDTAGQPKSNFQTFVQEHYTWATKNADFIRQHLDKDKARAYVMANK